MDDDFYNNPDNWSGAFYELSIEYHPSGNDKRVNEALKALGESRYFKGMWKERKDYQKPPISLPIAIEKGSVKSFYGTLAVSHSSEDHLPCMISVIRANGESDWVDIAIPEAAFERAFPYEYHLTGELNPWLKKINEVYAQLAETIYSNSPFDLAMIGEEISGYTNQEEITKEAMQNITCILPGPLQGKLGLEGKGTALSSQLRIFG